VCRPRAGRLEYIYGAAFACVLVLYLWADGKKLAVDALCVLGFSVLLLYLVVLAAIVVGYLTISMILGPFLRVVCRVDTSKIDNKAMPFLMKAFTIKFLDDIKKKHDEKLAEIEVEKERLLTIQRGYRARRNPSS